MASQQQASNTPLDLRDSLETPDWLYTWAHKRFGFVMDLAASANNSKCLFYFLSMESDALNSSWVNYVVWNKLNGFGWCNPPYSQPGKWLEKAWLEAQEGFRSVLLVPTPNGDDYWRQSVFGKASEIIFINGRISFIAPTDFVIKGKNGKPDKLVKKGDELKGNTRGSCFVVFNRTYTGPTAISWADRDSMKQEHSEKEAACSF